MEGEIERNRFRLWKHVSLEASEAASAHAAEEISDAAVRPWSSADSNDERSAPAPLSNAPLRRTARVAVESVMGISGSNPFRDLQRTFDHEHDAYWAKVADVSNVELAIAATRAPQSSLAQARAIYGARNRSRSSSRPRNPKSKVATTTQSNDRGQVAARWGNAPSIPPALPDLLVRVQSLYLQLQLIYTLRRRKIQPMLASLFQALDKITWSPLTSTTSLDWTDPALRSEAAEAIAELLPSLELWKDAVPLAGGKLLSKPLIQATSTVPNPRGYSLVHRSRTRGPPQTDTKIEATKVPRNTPAVPRSQEKPSHKPGWRDPVETKHKPSAWVENWNRILPMFPSKHSIPRILLHSEAPPGY